ncbi:hypothetical protein EKO27_g3520 [Xylaria grammica]|uniref:SRR1-like domain-containing protein n=1 Tax=Xylaria grammica TaxID=363999 RepID=A0A439DB25_9PEZI|nr:hypothetical protein EKO27_g3520 [Xylaria grammica]
MPVVTRSQKSAAERRDSSASAPQEEDRKEYEYRSSTGFDLYNSGKLIWTKEILSDFVAQIQSSTEVFFYRRMDGGFLLSLNKAFGEEPGSCAGTLESYEGWRTIQVLLSNYELPPTIDKIVCFGLGNDIVSNFEASSQHPAALNIRRLLKAKLGHDIRLLTQDPAYTSDTITVLEEHGFEVVGAEGIQGFLEVDQNTFVLSIYTSTCVKQIIADIARPAVFITAPFHESDLDWADEDWKVEEGRIGHPEERNVAALIRDRWDPDTPRTKAMFEEYYAAGPWAQAE